MWLKVGIPALVLLGLITVRVVYYVFWRKHWDRRPERHKAAEPTEVVVLDETGSHVSSKSPLTRRENLLRPNDARS